VDFFVQQGHGPLPTGSRAMVSRLIIEHPWRTALALAASMGVVAAGRPFGTYLAPTPYAILCAA
jgi:hypothetical protein